MLSIAAIILMDPASRRFAGLDLNERAALVAERAGIHYIHFVGAVPVDAEVVRRLSDRGLVVTSAVGHTQPLALAPLADRIVVLPAATVMQPGALKAALDQAAADPTSPAMIVDEGPMRKDALLSVEGGLVASVIGDGNASSSGVVVIPGHLVSRVRTVWYMHDIVHRLAKTGRLRAVSVVPHFWAVLNDRDDVTAVEREYLRASTGDGPETGLMRLLLRLAIPLHLPVAHRSRMVAQS